MNRVLIFIFMIPLMFSAASLSATRIIPGQKPRDSQEDRPLQRTVLPSPIASAERPLLSTIRESADTKHSVKSACCLGCCFGGCCGKKDGRYKVDPDGSDEYSNTVFITAYFPGVGWRRATGITAGRHSILLPAHAVRHEGVNATEVITVFGMRQVKECRCCFRSTTLMDKARAHATLPIFTIHPDYMADPDSNHDVAVMTFLKPSRESLLQAGVDISSFGSLYDSYGGVQITRDSHSFTYEGGTDFNLADTYGSANVGMYDDDVLEGARVSVTGYPAYVRKECGASFNMYSMEGSIAQVRPSVILYEDIDTSHGQSGGGVWRDGELIGIHLGEHSDRYNKAVRFDESVARFFTQSLDAFEGGAARV